jgi:hypothetical protein
MRRNIVRTSSREIAAWIAQGERGPAADTVVECLTEIPLCTPDAFGSYPQTPTELRHCLSLFEVVPTLRTQMNKLRNLGPQWSAVVEHWPELEQTLAAETTHGIGAPKTYSRLRELLNQAGDSG